MGTDQNFPLPGILLAGVTFVAVLLLGLDPLIAVSILIVWIGSLLLTAGRKPERAAVVVESRVSLETMRSLFENSATPILVTEKNTIALANRTARRMLGNHVLGQDVRVAFRQPEAIALFANERNGQALVRGLVRRQDIWQINRQSLNEGMALIELSDQTAEADISRAHTDFVANASHELRTPLASILGYVETLREGGETMAVPTAQKFLATIEREGRRLQSLISDLMSLSRIEAEKHDLPTTEIDFAAVVERAASDVAGSDRDERVRIALHQRPIVRGDQQQLEQVVRNLVDNALKYGDPKGEVIVELDLARDGQARMTVTDKGEGIAPQHLPHLTRRFYRTDPGRSRASGGTGLGLAIVKHIVERHRGRLDISSTLGEGTQVSVRIPVDEGTSSALAPPKNDNATTSV